MIAYTLRRLLALIPTLLVVTAITFFMGFFAPGDPITLMLGEKAQPQQVDNLKRQYGLDKPPLVQYARYLGGLAQGDLGKSYQYIGRSVGEMVREGFFVSMKLGLIASLIAATVGVMLGVIAAVNRGRWPDGFAMFLAVVGVSIPNFVEAILLMFIGAVWLYETKTALGMDWIPVPPAGGWGELKHYVLPVTVLGTRASALIARITRSAMLDVLGQDYVRTARAKGVASFQVTIKHSLRNALIPVITVLGTTLGGLISGTFVVEFFFGIPGIGKIALDAIGQRDYPVIQASTMLVASVFLLTNLVVDLMYGVVDPRIRYS